VPRLYDDSALAVAAHVLTEGPISRADVARELRLSGATLTRLVRPLVNAGLIDDRGVGTPQTGVGRPTQLLEIPPAAHHFIGINVTSSAAHAALTNACGQTLASEAVPLRDTDPYVVAGQIHEIVDSLAGQQGFGREQLRGIGLSLGGQLSDGVVEDSRFLGWHNVDLLALIGPVYGVPISLRNDLVALTMLEQWFGLGRTHPSFVVTSVGSGIGHGVVHHSRAVAPIFGGHGTTSHIPLAGARGVCQYGHIGCANGALTSRAVLARAHAGRYIIADDSRPDSLDDLVALAHDGDLSCQNTIAEFSRNLATYMQTVCGAAMTTDAVLDGEAVALLGTPWASGFDESLSCFHSPKLPQLRIHRRSGSFDRWARGAAVTAIVAWLETQVEAAR